MFTGIVEELGEVVAVERLPGAARLTVRGPRVTAEASHGDSIAVNGVCLTVTGSSDKTFTADVMAETLQRTGLGGLSPGSPVNLERPVELGGRLGGHLVQGHADGTGEILSRTPGEHWDVVRIATPPDLARYIVMKGSITVDGVSLTVSALGARGPGGTRPLVRGQPHPHHAGDDHARRAPARQPGEPGGRRDRQVRGEPAGPIQPGPGRRGRERAGSQVMSGEESMLDQVAQAVRDIADGRPVVVVDGADRENEGDIIIAASKMTPDLMAFMIRHTSGVICVPLPGEHLDRLQLPLMTPHNSERMRTAFTISVDARDGVTTGISAEDRARTVRTLVDSATEPYEIVRPGHIFPLRYAEGGVLRRPGHTEAAVDLARLAGLPAAGVLAEVVNDDGTMARLPQLREFADEHGLTLISIEQLIDYRRHSERMVRRVVETRLPNAYGEWRAFGYQNLVDRTEHPVLVLGDLGDGRDVLVRAHSECLTGDVFGSRRCDCGDQLEASMAAIAAEGRGVVLYLRGHEGRGIGLLSKLRAYQLQDAGADTVDANLELGLPADAREYSTGAQILADLGVRSVRLLTNNPAKVSGLSGFGIEVAGRVALPVTPTPENLRYLTVKRDRLGHLIDGLPVPRQRHPGHARRSAAATGNARPALAGCPVSAAGVRVRRAARASGETR